MCKSSIKIKKKFDVFDSLLGSWYKIGCFKNYLKLLTFWESVVYI